MLYRSHVLPKKPCNWACCFCFERKIQVLTSLLFLKKNILEQHFRSILFEISSEKKGHINEKNPKTWLCIDAKNSTAVVKTKNTKEIFC